MAARSATRPTTAPGMSAAPQADAITAESDGTKRDSGAGLLASVTAVRLTAPMESSHGVLTSTVCVPTGRPPTVKAPDESDAPSMRVPRNVMRASGTSAPEAESRTVPPTTTRMAFWPAVFVEPRASLPLASPVEAGMEASTARVGSGTFTTVSASVSKRWTRMASLGSRHAATSTERLRSRPRQSAIRPLEPVRPFSDTVRHREPSASLTRHLEPATGRPSLATTRASSHASLACSGWRSRSHRLLTYCNAVGTSTRTSAADARRAVSERPVGMATPMGCRSGSSTSTVYGPGSTAFTVARPFASVVVR